MLVFKFLSCFIAIYSTVLFIINLIATLTAGPELLLPWKENSKITGEEFHRRFKLWVGLIMAVFWSIVIVF